MENIIIEYNFNISYKFCGDGELKKAFHIMLQIWTSGVVCERKKQNILNPMYNKRQLIIDDGQ